MTSSPVAARASQLPPGPQGWEQLRALVDFQRDPLGTLQAYARRYGDVVRLEDNKQRLYLLSHPDHIEHVHLRSERGFDMWGEQDPTMRQVFGNGLIMSKGAFWQQQRRLVQPTFHRQRISAYATTMAQYTQRMLATWRSGDIREMHGEMTRLTLQIVVKTLFDTDLSHDKARVGEVFEAALEAYARQNNGLLALSTFLPNASRARFVKALAQLDAVVDDLIDDHLRSGDRGDVLSMLVAARDDDGMPMSRQQLRDEVKTMLIAGHETTANTLTWVWHLLAQTPAAMTRLSTEVEQVLEERWPAASDVPQLAYANAVIKETMRLYPAVQYVARVAATDTDIGGYHVPAGTMLLMSQWVVQRDPRWYPDPLAFRPERWMDGLEQRMPKYAYFPFGGGPRMCIGNSFSLMEAPIILAMIMQRFKPTPVPGQRVELEPTLMRPRHGLQMELEARS